MTWRSVVDDHRLTDVEMRSPPVAGTTIRHVLTGLGASRLASEPTLQPFMKWPGGKTQELPLIARAAPPLLGRYIDPFLGGGAVLLATPSNVPAWGNDICPELIGIYAGAASDDPQLRSALIGLGEAWDRLGDLVLLYRDLASCFGRDFVPGSGKIVKPHESELFAAIETAGPELSGLIKARLARDLDDKLDRMKRVEARAGHTLNDADLMANVEGAVRAAFYYAVRYRYNVARAAARLGRQRSADFFFLREFAYAAMFRFNASGEFNVPYGGVTYNRKSFASKVQTLMKPRMRERLQATEWRCTDFEPFLEEAQPSPGDFVFVDPPYDSDFSSYDNRSFASLDQTRLRDTLAALRANVMVVIKDTPMIRRLYGDGTWRIEENRKTYMWTIKSRNDREANHLVITNY